MELSKFPIGSNQATLYELNPKGISQNSYWIFTEFSEKLEGEAQKQARTKIDWEPGT